MSQIVTNGGVFTGVSDTNGNPVVFGFVGSGAPPAWTGPVPNKAPANLSSVAGVTQYPQAGSQFPQNIDPTNCGNGSTYFNTTGTNVATSRWTLIQGVWTGG